jgi:hypothetical protein
MSALEKRIAAALVGNDVTSADLATLIAETEAAIGQADATAVEARTRALDPLASPDAGKARESMQAAEFSRDCLRTVLPRLQARYAEIAAAEYLTHWRADYEVLKGKCDASASELGEVYPKVVSQLVDLLGRIAANDAELSSLHQARPSGAGLHLAGVELVARNLNGFTRDDPPIARDLKLPDWANTAKMAWPVPSVPLALLVAPAVSGDSHRYSGDWWQVKEDEARALRERQEREAAEQEAKARENWRGPRWWEGKRA